MQRPNIPQFAQLAEKAQALYNDSKYEKAMYYYNMAIDLNPVSATLYLQRAQCHSDCGNSLKAAIDNRLAEIFNPNKQPSSSESSKSTYHPDYYCELAKKHNLHRNYREAIQCCDQALESNPQCISAYYIRGFSFLASQEWLNALLDYQAVMALQKLFPKILNDSEKKITNNNLGVVWLQLDNPDEAIACFDDSLSHDSTDSHAYYYRGKAYQQKKQFAEAISDFFNAIQLSHNEASAALKELLETKNKEEVFEIIKTIQPIDIQVAVLKDCIRNKKSLFGQLFWKSRSIASPKLTRETSLLFEVNTYYLELLKGHRKQRSESKFEPPSPLASSTQKNNHPEKRQSSWWPFGRSTTQTTMDENPTELECPKKNVTPGKVT